MKPLLPEAQPPSSTVPTSAVTAVGPVETPIPSFPMQPILTRQDHTGQQLGDFRLIRRLGEGGMGQVYLAEQISLQRRVAIKLLRSDFAQNETFLKRFESEAKAIAQLTHNNIVQVYSVGNEQGVRYMALEYVEGTNLKDYLNKKGPPELPIALAIMRQVAAALLKASELGIIHRDIKPENILLTRKVEVKVADFGLSRMVGDEVHLTQTGTTMGTPLYMSPEQIMGKGVDTRTDLYSLGATCYHLLTGQPPFMAESAMAVGVQHLTDPPRPLKELRPDLPDELCQLVHRLLAKKADDRPQTAREVLREIRRIQESLSGMQTEQLNQGIQENDSDSDPLNFGATLTKSSPARLSSLDGNTRKRNWLIPVLGGSLMVAIIGGAVIGLLLRNEGQAQVRTTLAASKTSTDPRKILNVINLEHEKKLVQQVNDTRYPRTPDNPFPLERMSMGIRARAELMEYYFRNLVEEGIPSRARKFAEEEIHAAQAPESYRAIGHISLSVVLAYEGNARQSYEELEKSLAQRPNAPNKRPLLNQLLRNRVVTELVQSVFKMNEGKMEIPASLQALQEELSRIEKGGTPEKPKAGKQ